VEIISIVVAASRERRSSTIVKKVVTQLRWGTGSCPGVSSSLLIMIQFSGALLCSAGSRVLWRDFPKPLNGDFLCP
jgi:hypothetical protein